ncbi:MAG: aminotransferase class I/II-fold pyridoxal phosphate-dependent enzyme [Polyangiaceae bacterium]
MDFLIPSRRERPGDDPIFALNAEARKRKAAGDDIINATIGALLDDDGKLCVMPSVVEALASIAPEVTAAYAPIPGKTEYRQAVIDDLLGAYGLADRAVAVATPGGSGALRMAMDDFLDRGQNVLTSSFFWGPYRTLSDESGRGLDTFNMFTEEGRFDTADLDRAMGAQIAEHGRTLLILNTPCHNPTGYSLDAGEWKETVAVIKKYAAKAPVVVLLDVAYSYYAEEGLEVAMAALKDVVGEALVLFAWSASKSFAQYGLRVGALVALCADDAERARINNAMTYSCRGLWSNCNAGGQSAIAHVLTDPLLNKKAIAERAELVGLLGRRVERWNALAGPAKLTYPRYDGGFFTTVFCDDAQAAAGKLREQGIYVVPMKGAMRVAMCSVTEAEIERIVPAVADVLGVA